ncbi:hypothetical protein [Aquifex sp.]
MFKKLFSIFGKKEEKSEETQRPQETKVESTEGIQEQKEEKKVRELTPAELEEFKKAIGITPHNYWQWASRTNNFKLLTDGEWIWVEGYEEHIGKTLPLTQARAWSWKFIRERIRELGIK